MASAGYFIQGHGKVCRQPGVRYTYQLHMILRTPEVFRSVACRQPVSSSIRSGRCRRWSRTRARSHCYTDGNGQRAAALVTQAGWHSTHLGVPPPSLPVLKPRENNREGDAAPPPHISSYQGRGREGAFLKRQKAEEHKPDVNRLGKRFSEWAKCSTAAPRGASPCENGGGGAFPRKEYGQGKHLLASAIAPRVFPLDGNRQIVMNRLTSPLLLLHVHTLTATEKVPCTHRSVHACV